ncbi:dolichol kinase isoform X1 [Anastrepha ludens]|uniref:dolichol kinase isoform X1 n=1 Tax=Anastrepha ludens TaxID=28586 RepID=UPI0023AEEA9D|nr:dolichol kinase isoform X1 [Anastrepha ludens]
METENSEIGAESSAKNEQAKEALCAGNGRVSSATVARPNAASGHWLCMLLPLALASNLVHKDRCTEQFSTQAILTIAVIGMSLEFLGFILYKHCKSNLLLKLLIAFVPGLITALLNKIVLRQSWSYGLFWGFVTTFCYQNTYMRVMRRLPGCFSYGEATVLVQGLMLFLLNIVLKIPNIFFLTQVRSEFEDLNVIMMCALFYLLIVCCLLASVNTFQKPVYFYPLMLLLAIAVTCTPITKPIPIITLLKFILRDEVRLKIICFYFALVALTVLIVWWQTGSEGKASTRLRKIFHFLIVLVYVPGLTYQCSFLYIASGVAFAIFTVLELIRICNVYPLADALGRAFGSFSDEKDAGILALTPFCLLIGCSLPMWISPCPCGLNVYTSENPRILPLLAGVLTIGFGDTAASVVGSKFGRIKWRNSNKSLEGTLAFVLITTLAILCFNYFGLITMSTSKWLTAGIATVTTALVEAHTDQIDNLTLPIIFYIIAMANFRLFFCHEKAFHKK